MSIAGLMLRPTSITMVVLRFCNINRVVKPSQTSCHHLQGGASTHLVSSGQTVDLHLGTGHAIAEVVKRSARVGLKTVTEIRSPEKTSRGTVKL